jgi:hypothetical protein
MKFEHDEASRNNTQRMMLRLMNRSFERRKTHQWDDADAVLMLEAAARISWLERCIEAARST